jgi:hypothetical protein
MPDQAHGQAGGEARERTRLQVLESLQRGEITVDEALALLKRIS